MKKMIVIGAFVTVMVAGSLAFTAIGDERVAWAASTFTGSTVLEIEAEGRTVTIRTSKGESLSLVVADPAMMKGVNKGDQVSLELGPDDRVNKIVKVEGGDSPHPREAPKGRSNESEN